MAIDITSLRGRTLLQDALAQSDVDMAFHKLLNLDTSNLSVLGAPPTIVPPTNNWLKAWDNATHTWTHQQINFVNLAGALTLGLGGQQQAITQLGQIGIGVWRGTALLADKVPRLDLISPPGADLSMAFHKITNVADPTNSQDAVNLRFLDSMIQGLNPKQQVRLATAAPVNLFGLPTIDGKQTAVSDRILVKDGVSTAYLQGIYVIGSDPAHTWLRSTDCNHTDPAHPETDINRAYCTVLEGTLNGGTSWVQVNPCVNPSPDYNLEPKHFILFSSASAVGPPGPPGVGVPSGGSTHQVLRKVDGTNFNTEWADPTGGLGTPPPVYASLLTAVTGNLGGVSDTAGRMAGLAGYITPSATGRILATIGGYLWNDNPSGQVSVRLVVGSGTAPANNAVRPTSTSVIVGPTAAALEGGATHAVPFSVTAIINNLTPFVQFWFDLIITPATTGNALVGGISITAVELA